MQNRSQKHVFFQYRFLSVFFPDFDDLGSIFGGLGPSKNLKKLRKIDSNLVSGRIWNAFEISIRCWSNLGRFGMDFGRILEWFLLFFFAGLEGTSISETFQVEGLISMIRATRGRSRRPNHMRSQIGRPKAMAPVDFRRLARGFHSVAKQASFCVAFWSDFGGFWKPKWTQKSMFEPFFFDLFFECVFGSIFAWFLEARNLKNINFASTGARFLQNRYFQKISKKCSILTSFWEA